MFHDFARPGADFFDVATKGGGNDTLYFGEGTDSLYGGLGADTFVAEETTSNNNDMAFVFDFVEGTDVIDISNLLTGYDPLTDLLSDFVTIAQGANTTIQVDRDGTGTTHSLDNILRIQGNSTISTDADQLVTDGTLLVA